MRAGEAKIILAYVKFHEGGGYLGDTSKLFCEINVIMTLRPDPPLPPTLLMSRIIIVTF
jgi:hypothetical protein